MLQIGIKGSRTLTVTDALTARVMGSGELDVFATPAMAALIEKTAFRSAAVAQATAQSLPLEGKVPSTARRMRCPEG